MKGERRERSMASWQYGSDKRDDRHDGPVVTQWRGSVADAAVSAFLAAGIGGALYTLVKTFWWPIHAAKDPLDQG